MFGISRPEENKMAFSDTAQGISAIRMPGAGRDRLAQWMCAAILLSCMLAIIVHVTYIAAAPLDDTNANAQALLEAADGDDSKKFIYTFFFGSVFLLAGTRRMFDSISWPYRLAIAWCLLSCVWAIDPSVSIRRSMAMVMILVAISGSIRVLGARRTLKIVYAALALILLASFVSVVLAYGQVSVFLFAIHPANEADPTLIGAWRGVMMHKNVAGAVMTHASIIFLHFSLNRGRRIDWLLFVGSIIFLIGTKSKTSLALDGVILIIGMLYRLSALRAGGLKIFSITMLYALISASIIGWALSDEIGRYFSDPDSVSGRVAIWTSLMTYIRSHPILGSGYGSFWTIGNNSPIYAIATKPFILGIGHSHSGYFEILVTCGVVGLCLAVFALVIWPLYRFLTVKPTDAKLGALCFSVWLFGVLQNFTESQFFAADKQSWLFVVISICLIQNIAVDRIRESARRAAMPRWLTLRVSSTPKPIVTTGSPPGLAR
jgi:exopolysaccharide production protein ExoQ